MQNIRFPIPTQEMIRSLSHGRVLFESIPSTHDLYNKLKNYPDSLVLTVKQRSAAYINDLILKHIFTNHPLALVVADDESRGGKIFFLS